MVMLSETRGFGAFQLLTRKMREGEGGLQGEGKGKGLRTED